MPDQPAKQPSLADRVDILDGELQIALKFVKQAQAASDMDSGIVQNEKDGDGMVADGSGLIAAADGHDMPFAYVGPAPESAPENEDAQFLVGWVEVITAGDDALIGTPAADPDNPGQLLDDTVKTESVTLNEGDNFVYAHFYRDPTPGDSTLVLARADTWNAIPNNTNDDYYYPIALVTLELSTEGEGEDAVTTGTQTLVQQYRAGVIMWNAKPKTLVYCVDNVTHIYEIPTYEAPPPE